MITLERLLLAPPSRIVQAPPGPQRKFLFVGDSVTCGAAVAENAACKPDPQMPSSDAYNSYGLLLGRRLDAQVHLVCYGGRGVERDYRGLSLKDGVLNAPDFLDLAIAADNSSERIPWDATNYIPDAIVVSLGTNDFSLENTKPLNEKAFVKDLATILHRLRTEYPHAQIFATEGAIVTDPRLRQYVREAVTELHDDALTHWAAAEHYPGNGCNAHPTAAQHQQMADDLEILLRRQLSW